MTTVADAPKLADALNVDELCYLMWGADKNGWWSRELTTAINANPGSSSSKYCERFRDHDRARMRSFIAASDLLRTFSAPLSGEAADLVKRLRENADLNAAWDKYELGSKAPPALVEGATAALEREAADFIARAVLLSVMGATTQRKDE